MIFINVPGYLNTKTNLLKSKPDIFWYEFAFFLSLFDTQQDPRSFKRKNKITFFWGGAYEIPLPKCTYRVNKISLFMVKINFREKEGRA